MSDQDNRPPSSEEILADARGQLDDDQQFLSECVNGKHGDGVALAASTVIKELNEAGKLGSFTDSQIVDMIIEGIAALESAVPLEAVLAGAEERRWARKAARELATGLRALADLIEDVPALAPIVASQKVLAPVMYESDPVALLAAIARAGVSRGGKVAKSYDDKYGNVDVAFGPVVVTGTRQVTKKCCRPTPTASILAPARWPARPRRPHGRAAATHRLRRRGTGIIGARPGGGIQQRRPPERTHHVRMSQRRDQSGRGHGARGWSGKQVRGRSRIGRAR